VLLHKNLNIFKLQVSRGDVNRPYLNMPQWHDHHQPHVIVQVPPNPWSDHEQQLSTSYVLLEDSRPRHPHQVCSLETEEGETKKGP
jgi:hypothetical protein